MHNSFKIDCTQVISAVRDARPRHSNPELLQETTFCLVEDHETKSGPRKRQYPPVLWRSSRQDA